MTKDDEFEKFEEHNIGLMTPEKAFRAGRIVQREKDAEICERRNPQPDQWSDNMEFTEKRVVLACAAAIREQEIKP